MPTIPTVEIAYMYEGATRHIPKEPKHEGDVGIDLPAILSGPVTLGPGAGIFVPSGYRVQFPDGFFGLVLPRSSTNRRGLHVCTGVIDNGYIGELGAEVRNISHYEITIEPGERIAQLVVMSGWRPAPIPVVAFRHTDRGEKGFGSSNDNR